MEKRAATKPLDDPANSAGWSCTLTEKEFQQIRALAHARFGLDLRDGKQHLVAARLGKKMRQGAFGTFADYYRHVTADPGGQALVELIDALATNHTSFLREQAHFDLLAKTVRSAPTRLPSVWSAACSTGEEPYSIVFTVLHALSRTSARQVAPFVLATDISTRALEHARQGCFAPERLAALPDGWKKTYLVKASGEREGWQKVKAEIASLIEFRRLNLIEPFRHGRMFDFIFCRNVMIYFDRATQKDLVNRLAGCLHPGGYLFVGHSESLSGIEHPLEYTCPAVYRRKEKR